MDFKNQIKKNKPSMSDGSIKTYNSLLKTIYNNVFKDDDKPDFKDHKKVMAFLNEKPYSSRKTYLSALVCIEPDVDEYKKQMLVDIKNYDDETNKSKMTDKLTESKIEKEEIDEIVDKLKRDAELLYKKKSLKISDLMDIQNYIIISLYYGHIVPRRATDYVLMGIRNFTEDDNYIDFKKNRFVFNKFKTATKMGQKLRGQQTLDIPPSLKKILVKWINIIPPEVDTLLFTSNFKPMTNVILNQRLNSIFKGKKGVNALRHFYLTSKYKELMMANEVMGDDMEDMGSSISQAKNYVKINE
jgi:hypothetical protein